jgi:hypothetical protein
VSKANDRFTVENSAQFNIDIASLSKKEICLLTGTAANKVCASKKGKTVVSK